MKNKSTALLPYGRQWIGKEEKQAVQNVLDSDWLTQGPQISAFEKALAAYCGSAYATAFSNGTAALHGACHALGLKAGDEVLVSPLTFIASANSVLYCGARPVFVDIDPITRNIDPSQIERHISPKTRAIMAVDFAGLPCDYDFLKAIAQRHHLALIEDAAHAIGGSYKGHKIGSIADMTVFSFHPIKSITTGEGGAVVTTSPELYQKLQTFHNHGITRDPAALRVNEGPWHYEMQDLGFNYRITDIQCAIGIQQLRKLDAFIKRRREIVKKYTAAFQDSDLAQWPIESGSLQSAWHLYAIRLNVELLTASRRTIFEELRSLGLGVQVHYLPVYRHPYYQQLGYGSVRCPQAERFYEGAISLPLFPKMTDNDVDFVIRTVRTVLARYAKSRSKSPIKRQKKKEQLA